VSFVILGAFNHQLIISAQRCTVFYSLSFRKSSSQPLNTQLWQT